MIQYTCYNVWCNEKYMLQWKTVTMSIIATTINRIAITIEKKTYNG